MASSSGEEYVTEAYVGVRTHLNLMMRTGRSIVLYMGVVQVPSSKPNSDTRLLVLWSCGGYVLIVDGFHRSGFRARDGSR